MVKVYFIIWNNDDLSIIGINDNEISAFTKFLINDGFKLSMVGCENDKKWMRFKK